MRCLLILFGFLTTAHAQVFAPANRLSGLGVDRKGMSDLVLQERTRLMVESQTFSIMRDPRAVAGAERITGPRLQKIFEDASRNTGFPAATLAAMAYLESWGDANAESPAGPKGIMQFSKATAARAGLKVTYATRYRIADVKKPVKIKGKTVMRVVKQRTSYQVLVRDERLIPERAVPAAARYLTQMEARFGGRDLAIFAYHCGEGCVSDFVALAAGAKDIPSDNITVPKLFFSENPAYNRELFEAMKLQMARDYSPTYYFRVKRAQELLDLYRSDRPAFRALAVDYRDHTDPSKRASNRLNVWLKPADMAYNSCEDLKNAEGKGLFRVMDQPQTFGFKLRTAGPGAIGAWDPKNQSYYLMAAPSAVGTLVYISFETRRLFDALKPRNEKYVPLEVTSLVRPSEFRENGEDSELPSHCTGQVFDIAFDFLPPHEKECLEFVLDDMGWDGHLGFTQSSDGTMHIGSAPSARDFFLKVYQEAMARKGKSSEAEADGT